MHELYKLESVALEGYASYNFPKGWFISRLESLFTERPFLLSVINSLTNFTNITLSSLYFDITKDCLYANSLHSEERRAVVTVLEQVILGLIA